MTPDEINAAAQALVTATQTAATSSGQSIEANAGQLAPGLVTGSNAPGGLNFQKNVAPLVPVMTNQFVTAAKQGVLRGAIRDAINSAQVAYDDAKYAYQGRQRGFQQRQASKSRDRQARSDAAMAQATLGGGSISGGGNSVGTVTTNASSGKYLGNDDYRGALAYAAANGNQDAKIALNFVGNDGKYYINFRNPPNQVADWNKIKQALANVGATNAWQG